MRINNNLMAMNTHRAMGSVQGAQSKSMEKLSSGYRINRAGDDAAGLAISEKMRGQIRGLNQASRNSQDGISMIQTAEGALNETQSILQRMRELAVQSANDTNVDADRTSIQNEIDQLSTEITRISDTTEFNTQKLLNGSLSDIQFQIGANEGQNMELSIGDMRADALKVVSDSVTAGSKGEAIKGISADSDFEIEGATITAAAGGAVGATMESVGGISASGYATNVEFKYSQGVSNTNGVSFAGTGNITLSGGEIPWDTINTSGGTGTMTISGNGDDLIVRITVSGSGGDAQFNIVDTVEANADGSYTYDAHGVQFDLTAEDFVLLVSGDISIDFDTVKASGTTVDFTGNLDMTSNMTQTLSGADKAVLSGGTVYIDAASEDFLGGDRIKISGAGLETSGGTISVIISSGATVISQDEYTLDSTAFISGAGTGTFSYDNHGIKFTVDLNSATDIGASGAFTTYEESATLTADRYKITITDDNDVAVTFSGGMDAGEYGLAEIAANINAAADAAGTFSGSIATVSGGEIYLTSNATGADAKITIEDNGGLGALFTNSSTENGSESSINLTLTEADGDVRTATGISSSATSATFTDTDGNQAQVKLKGYSSLDGINVPEAFAASSITVSKAGIDVSSKEAASAAITTINDAIESVSAERSKLGAVQNRLEHTIANLDTSAENLQASESRIRDVDMAKEMMEFTKNNILQQAAQSMLAQANQAPQGVLQLLR